MDVLARARRKLRREGPVALLLDGMHFAIREISEVAHATIFSARQRVSGSIHTDVNGVKVDLASEVIPYVVVKNIRNGSYEGTECTLVEKHVDIEHPVIELGTGIGYVSCHIDRQLGDEIEHVSVEANPDLVPIAERTKNLNDADFTIINKAYAPGSESVDFVVDESFPWSGLQSTRSPDKVISVSTTSLRQLCDTFGFETFSLVADIEGAEFELVEREFELLRSLCALMIIEFHEISDGSIDCLISQIERGGFEQIDRKDKVFVFRNDTI